MKITEAQALIQEAFAVQQHTARWADLGCGGGIFTYALANCLASGSQITAIDKQTPVLHSINNVDIQCVQADMEHLTLLPGELDGIVMANSFHYIKDKGKLVQRLKPFLKAGGLFLIVEYDTFRANRWVPYLLPFETLQLLLETNGFTCIEKIGERSSVFGPQKMYASLTRK